jgi:hypothetical protein
MLDGMRYTLRVVLVALASVVAWGQSDRPKFEVVAVKPCRDGEAPPAGGRKGAGGGRISAAPGRLIAECATLRALIRSAYAKAEGPISRDIMRGADAFDIHLFGMNDALKDSPDAPPSQSNLTAALEATIPRLGLKLEPAKGATEFLVIDHVERPAVDR